jgi:hypothetical protein
MMVRRAEYMRIRSDRATAQREADQHLQLDYALTLAKDEDGLDRLLKKDIFVLQNNEPSLEFAVLQGNGFGVPDSKHLLALNATYVAASIGAQVLDSVDLDSTLSDEAQELHKVLEDTIAALLQSQENDAYTAFEAVFENPLSADRKEALTTAEETFYGLLTEFEHYLPKERTTMAHAYQARITERLQQGAEDFLAKRTQEVQDIETGVHSRLETGERYLLDDAVREYDASWNEFAQIPGAAKYVVSAERFVYIGVSEYLEASIQGLEHAMDDAVAAYTQFGHSEHTHMPNVHAKQAERRMYTIIDNVQQFYPGIDVVAERQHVDRLVGAHDTNIMAAISEYTAGDRGIDPSHRHAGPIQVSQYEAMQTALNMSRPGERIRFHSPSLEKTITIRM